MRRPARSARALAAFCVLVGAVAAFDASAGAVTTITFDGSPGTASPPTTLGGYAMTPFGLDGRPLFTNVADVPGPGGTITFSPGLDHRRIGNGWGTWSHGYAGDVYRTGAARSVVITMPEHTVAFFLYVEPQPFASVLITATAQDGTSSGAVPVDGLSGARYFGFFASASTVIATISVSATTEFAIGEFGIALGAPPDCSTISSGSTRLWPPDHKLRTVKLSGPDNAGLEVVVTKVTQDEPPTDAGPGTAALDAAPGASAGSVMLRAERSGPGDGRVYHIAFVATARAGTSCAGSLAVSVPHDARDAAVDSAPPGYVSYAL